MRQCLTLQVNIQREQPRLPRSDCFRDRRLQQQCFQLLSLLVAPLVTLATTTHDLMGMQISLRFPDVEFRVMRRSLSSRSQYAQQQVHRAGKRLPRTE
jgi:hypothetical protein